jgi:hypothetical protein
VPNITSVAGARIYPNPATDRILVSASEATNARICNMTGEMVLEANGDTINITSLPTGVYLITLTSKDGEVLLRDKVMKW